MKAADRLAAVSALALASASPAAVPAVQPSPRYNFQHAEWWFGRFDRLRALAAAEGPSFKVAFVGDSITEHWEAEGKAVWDRVFAGPKYRAINLGFGGDRTENVLWRIRNGQLDGLDPDAVVVLVGTNNTFSRNEREEPPADTERAVAEIVRSVRERCPRARVVLHPILPSGEKPDDPKRLRDARANELIRALEDGERVLWCDFGPKLLAPDGTLPKEIAPDFVHPGEKGYEIWAEALLPYLDRCLGYSDACPRQAFPVDARTFVWTNPLHAAKRDEIAANPERYYDIALVGDPVPGTPGDDARRAPLREGMAGVRFLDFPLASVPRVPTLLWAVEDAGLCDGYSARVVAIPGDTVEITSSNNLIINGSTMVENDIYFQTPPYDSDVEYPLTLGENEYFVLADNRTQGMDSRWFGPVTHKEISGTVIAVLRRNHV